MRDKVIIGCAIYDYDDLSEKTKEKLLRQISETVAECYRADHIEDEYRSKLEAIGFIDVEFWWSVNVDQYDGACFECQIDPVKVSKHLCIKYDQENEWSGSIKSLRYNSVNENSCSIESDAPEEIIEKIEELRLELCNEFYNAVKKDYESEISKDNLLEKLRSCRYALCDALQRDLAEASKSEMVQII